MWFPLGAKTLAKVPANVLTEKNAAEMPHIPPAEVLHVPPTSEVLLQGLLPLDQRCTSFETR